MLDPCRYFTSDTENLWLCTVGTPARPAPRNQSGPVKSTYLPAGASHLFASSLSIPSSSLSQLHILAVGTRSPLFSSPLTPRPFFEQLYAPFRPLVFPAPAFICQPRLPALAKLWLAGHPRRTCIELRYPAIFSPAWRFPLHQTVGRRSSPRSIR